MTVFIFNIRSCLFIIISFVIYSYLFTNIILTVDCFFFIEMIYLFEQRGGFKSIKTEGVLICYFFHFNKFINLRKLKCLFSINYEA